MRNMTALAVQEGAVRVFKFYKMVVKYFAIILSFSHFSSAHALRFYRVSSFKPINYINVMNMLFQNMIATEPGEVIPVAHLIFHFCLTGLSFIHPNTIIIPP